MSDKEIFNKVVLLCARDVHKTRNTDVRRKIPPLQEMTNNITCMIKEEEDPEDIIFEAARQSGLNYEKFSLKLTIWLYAFNNKQWCTLCNLRPIRKGNRRFCSYCFSKTAGKDNMFVSGGHRVKHTGGTGRQK